MSRKSGSGDNQAAAISALAALIAAALADWPSTLRLAVICTALSVPAVGGLALYLWLR